MKSKRILSIILVFVMVFAMAAAGCGKKEEAAEKEEPKQEETSGADEAEVDDEDDAEAADEEDESSDGVMKTGEDFLAEEDIESLNDSIRDTVISEYLEPNNITVEDFRWPDLSDECWNYFIKLVEYLTVTIETGVEMPVEEPSNQNQEIMMAVLNGITNWLDGQGSYDAGYFINATKILKPYNSIIPTIDLAAK